MPDRAALRDYVARHRLEHHLAQAIDAVLRDQPADPVAALGAALLQRSDFAGTPQPADGQGAAASSALENAAEFVTTWQMSPWLRSLDLHERVAAALAPPAGAAHYQYTRSLT